MQVKRSVSLILELEHLVDLYLWARERALRKGALRSAHVALLRRTVLNRKATLVELSQATGISKFTASRTAKSLVRWKLIKQVDHKASKKTKLFRPTQRGITTLNRIDRALVEEILDLLDLNEGDEELSAFICQLDSINGFLPRQGVGTPRFFVPPDRDVRKPRLKDPEKLPIAFVTNIEDEEIDEWDDEIEGWDDEIDEP